MQRRTGLVVMVLVCVGAATLGLAKDEAKTFPAASGGTLVLELDAGGSATIEGSGGKSIEVAYTESCSPPCEVEFEETSGGLTIRTAFSEAARSQTSDMVLAVKVPARFDVEVTSVGGDISIDGVEGSFTGKTAGGDIALRRLQGEAELTTMGGDIELSDSDLDGSLKTMGGNVTIENVVGDVRGKSMGGNVRYKNVQTRGGRIASPEPDRAEIAELDPETVQISTMGGDVEVAEAPAGADLHTMGGSIDVRGAHQFVRATTMGGDIDIESIDGWVQATTNGGDIEVRVTGDGGQVLLTSHSGEIELSIPQGFGMDLDVEIAYTRNSSQDFAIVAPGNLKQTTSDWDHAHGSPRKYIRMAGAVNGGGHAVKVRTVNGNVAVREER